MVIESGARMWLNTESRRVTNGRVSGAGVSEFWLPRSSRNANKYASGPLIHSRASTARVEGRFVGIQRKFPLEIQLGLRQGVQSESEVHFDTSQLIFIVRFAPSTAVSATAPLLNSRTNPSFRLQSPPGRLPGDSRSREVAAPKGSHTKE